MGLELPAREPRSNAKLRVQVLPGSAWHPLSLSRDRTDFCSKKIANISKINPCFSPHTGPYNYRAFHNGRESRYVSEEELPSYISQGWELVAQVNGRILVKRSLSSKVSATY